MNIKYRKWSDISINKFNELEKVIKEDLDDLDREVALMAILCDATEEEILNLPMGEIVGIRNDMSFINEFKWNDKREVKKIKVDGLDLRMVDIKEMTLAQYVDFQTFYERKMLAEIISVFYVPKGKKYNEGYDMEDVINKIKENLDIISANEIVFFSLMKYLKYLKVTLTSLIWKTRMLKLMVKEKVMKDQMQMLIDKGNILLSQLGAA